MKNKFFDRAAAIAVAICITVIPLTASAAESAFTLARIENTPISYAGSTPQSYIETAEIAYCSLPENVKTHMAASGMNIYITNTAEVANLPSSSKAGTLTGGYTLIYRKNTASTYISLQSDTTGSDATIPLIHEVGHYVDAYCNSQINDYVSNTQQFIDLSAKYSEALRDVSEKYTNRVLHTEKRSEIYAQAFVMMICFPDVLEDAAPELYQFMITSSSGLGTK